MSSSNSKVLPGGVPVQLAALVDYSKGAVISKTLIRQEKGSLTLFSFDAEQGLSEHTAPFDAFVQILDGNAEITIGGKPIMVAAGQSILMPANVSHALRAVSPFKMLLTMIRG